MEEREGVSLKGHSGQIECAAFSPDGQRIVTGSADHTAKVWDATTGRELLNLEGHKSEIYSVAFSPNGQRIVSGSYDTTAKVWDATTGREVLPPLKGHSGLIKALAFSPDGRRIVTGSWDRTAKLWEVATGREVLTLKGHNGPVLSVAFSPDGQRIVTGSGDGTARIWEAASTEQVAAWQAEERAAARSLEGLQREWAAEREREWAAERERERAVRESDEGRIRRWLILAPIPLATGQSGAQGLDTEQIEDEAQLRPSVGETISGGNDRRQWAELTLREPEDYTIDFNALLGHVTTQSVAYAVCYIRSETEQRGLEMLVGSDDEAKVYLNGKRVYESRAARPCVVDEDTVPEITLNAGINVLVFKVVNERAGWQGSIRLADAQGNPVQGIKVTLAP